MKRPLFRPGSTKLISFFYFFLLLYTIAALVWWGILLHQQNSQIMALQQQVLVLRHREGMTDASFAQEAALISRERRLRNLQYLGEGSTFLLIILLSAGFVFQAMRRQIRFGRQQQNFMAAVTHELKSPIAVIRLNTETLQRHTLDDERRSRIYENTLGELNRLNQLCNNMLLASQFDSRQYHLTRETVDLSALVGHIAVESAGRLRHHRLESSVQEGVLVSADVFMLQIAIHNLLDNAAKYAPSGTTIFLGLKEEHAEVSIRVADEGPGIPAAEKGRIFSRFYRVGNENTRRSKGTGLGLFLTSKIVRQHGGRIAVLDNKPKGTIFEILLPRLPRKDVQT
jgi:signal transduction histidine kinase